MAAAGHTFATLGATLASWAGAAEERVADFNARFAEVHADLCRDKCLGDPHFFGDGPYHVIGCSHGRIRDDSEHALCLVVERCQLGAPVSDVAPTGVVKERREGLVERVAVDQGTSTYAHA